MTSRAVIPEWSTSQRPSTMPLPPSPTSPPIPPAPPSNPMDASQEVPLKAQVPPLMLVGAIYWPLQGGAGPCAALRGWGWVLRRLGPRPLCSRCGGRWRPGWEVCARVCRAVGSCGSRRLLSASSAPPSDGWRKLAGPAPWGRPRLSPSASFCEHVTSSLRGRLR